MSEFTTVPLVSLHLDPNNARLHPDDSLDALCRSLKQFGQPEPLVVQRSRMRVIAGNGRLEAMRRLGWSECAVRLVDWNDRKAQAYALASNRTAELSSWSVDRLSEQVDSLKVDFDLDGLGFDQASLDALLAPEDDEAPDADGTKAADGVLDVDALQEPDIPEAPAVPTTQRGDIWELGAHRLMCGDSTSAQDVQALMGGERASLVFTSPPYAQQRDYGAKIGDWDALMQGVFGRLGDAATDEAQVLVNLGMVHSKGEWLPYWDPWIKWMRAQGWRPFSIYCWDQGHGLPGRWFGRLAPSHEFIFHFNRTFVGEARKSKASKMHGSIQRRGSLRESGGGDRVEYREGTRVTLPTKVPDSVIRVQRHRGSCGGHPAPFSVALVAEIYAAYSDVDNVCYEPFAGSGTCILTAEQLGRVCYAMEMEPAYVDIALARWTKLTGKQPVRRSI